MSSRKALFLLFTVSALSCNKPGSEQTDPTPINPSPVNLYRTVSTIAGNGVSDGFNGASTISPIHNPVGIAIDNNENIYVAEYNRIKKITPSGNITVLAGSGARGFINDTGAVAEFNLAIGITVDQQGNVYVADRDNGCIRKITPAGLVSTFAGSSNYGYVDGPKNNAKFWEPVAVAADLQGNLYVSDKSNHRIRKISTDGLVTTLAGNGKFGFKDGAGNQAEFRSLAGIAVDKDGNVYVADENNHRIRKITPAGFVSTLAGSGIASYQNGIGSGADFAHPIGITADSQGNVYVGDDANVVIRKVTSSGAVTTIAGVSQQRGFADGPVATAKFYTPNALAIDKLGNVFVADRANHRIRKISN